MRCPRTFGPTPVFMNSTYDSVGSPAEPRNPSFLRTPIAVLALLFWETFQPLSVSIVIFGGLGRLGISANRRRNACGSVVYGNFGSPLSCVFLAMVCSVPNRTKPIHLH